MRGGGQPY